MRIKSSFKDFYDIHYYSKDDLVYIRESKDVEGDCVRQSDFFDRCGQTLQIATIGFCGYFYTAVNFYPSYDWIYVKGVNEYHKLFNDSGYYSYIGKRYLKFGTIIDYFKPRSNDEFLRYKAPIILPCDSKWDGKKQINQITLNGLLRPYQFYKIFPPAMAYQEISHYLGNILTNNPVVPVVSDEDLIVAKGFDLKYSFRKDKRCTTK